MAANQKLHNNAFKLGLSNSNATVRCMKTLKFLLVLHSFITVGIMAQTPDSLEPNHGATNAPVLDASKKAKDEISWELLQKYDLKAKKGDKSLTERLKKDLTLTGFAIPLEFDKKHVNEFLLVPYVPSCMHVPPPPENQIVYVKLDKPEAVDNLWYPLQVSGKLTLDEKKTKDALYNFSASKVVIIKE